MKFSRIKVLVFLLALLVLAWFLYPREIFLGLIYEGAAELRKSENYYQNYLEKNPNSRFATLRLASLYERRGEPEQATPLLKRLWQHRRKDWESASAYLNHLEETGAAEELYRARLEVARSFMKEPIFPSGRIVELLDNALRYALWNQKTGEAFAILEEIIALESKPADYFYLRKDLLRGMGKGEELAALLEKDLERDPDDRSAKQTADRDTRLELSNIYWVEKKPRKAFRVLNDGLARTPGDKELLKQRAYLHTRAGRAREAIADYSALLRREDLGPQERGRLEEYLASLYVAIGDLKRARRLYEKALQNDRFSKKNWDNLLFVVGRGGNLRETLSLLEEYLSLFPGDAKKEREYVHMRLFDLKDLSVVDEYWNTFVETRDTELVLGLFDLLETERLYGEGARLAEALLRRNPDHPLFTVKGAKFYQWTGKRERARELLNRLAALRWESGAQKLAVARELLFMGERNRAADFLKTLVREMPDLGPAWFWYEEALYGIYEKERSREAARKVVALLEKKKPRSLEEERMLLKSKGRLHFTPEIEQRYAEWIARFPENLDFRIDRTDFLIDGKRFDAAAAQVAEIEIHFPREDLLVRQYRFRLVMERKEWMEAIRLGEDLLKESPTDLSLRTDLGGLTARIGKWQRGVSLLEEVRREMPEDKNVERLLMDLRRLTDHRADLLFSLADFGADHSFAGGVRARSFLKENLLFSGESWTGNFKSASDAFEGVAGFGRFTLEKKRWRGFGGEGGLGYGLSAARQTPVVLGNLYYLEPDRWRGEVGGTFRELRTDFPEAVSDGVLMDRAWLKGETFHGRAYFHGRYEFKRNSLPGGAAALEHLLEPGVSWELLREPELDIGYTFSFNEVDDLSNFLGTVPLVPSIRSHILGLRLRWRKEERLSLEGRFFIGEDTARDLHLAEADLWGAGGSLEWRLVDWLDVNATYDFSKERLTTVSGRTHQFQFAISAHWH